MFWDYENLALPASIDAAAQAVQRIRQVAQKYGKLVECRIYFDSAKQRKNLGAKHRDALNMAGFTLIDCPTSDKKDAID